MNSCPSHRFAGTRSGTTPLAMLLITVCALVLAACAREQSAHFAPLPADAVVLVIGDSLVAGTGARRGESWPDELERRTGWSVVNAGIPGHTSADALQRLPGLLREHRPDAVIIAVGGNDFLRNVPLDHTRRHLEAMIDEARRHTAHVALMALPEVSVSRALAGRLSDHGLFAELAHEHELALIASSVSDVLSRAELRADRIHANAAGYAVLGERAGEALTAHGWVGP